MKNRCLLLIPSLAAALMLASCGDIKELADKTASNDPASNTRSAASDQNPLEKLLAGHLGATGFKISVNQPEITHLTCVMPDGAKHTWVLSIIPHPEQAKTYAQMMEQNRDTPGFEKDLGQGAFWGHNGEPTLTVILRDDLAFVLANHTQLPFHELAAAVTDPETGGKWRADAAKIATPLAEHLRQTFPAKN